MQKIIEKIAKISREKKEKIFIVGGFLRDKILNIDTFDIDFIVFGNVMVFAKSVADSLKGSFFNLNKKFGFFRVVIKKRNKTIQLDFAKPKGKNLKADLSLRDFTINTLSAEISNPGEIIDEFNAIKDIKRKIIREVNNKIFKFDPLRILRAIRFSSNLKFSLSDTLKKLIKKDRFLLESVAGERIRDELFKILEVDDCVEHIRLMDKLKVLEVLFPEILPMKKIKQSENHHLDVWNHSLETVRLLHNSIEKIEKLDMDLKGNIGNYLNEEMTKGRKRIEIIKFAALFHDIAKPDARKVIDGKIRFLRHESMGPDKIFKIGKEIKLSKKEIKLLKILVLSHLRPGNLSCEKKVTKRAVSRFVFDLNKDCIGVLILSLADRLAARGKVVNNKVIAKHIEITKRILSEYKNSLVSSNLPKLINGDDLIEKFGLTQGPLIGKILAKVRESQIVGKISTYSEAITFVKSIM